MRSVESSFNGGLELESEKSDLSRDRDWRGSTDAITGTTVAIDCDPVTNFARSGAVAFGK